MNQLCAYMFPDVALGDSTFLSSSLVYFDTLVLPYMPNAIGEDAIIKPPGSSLATTLEKHGLNVEEARRKYSRQREIIRGLEGLQSEGIVRTLLPFNRTEEYVKKHEKYTNQVLADLSTLHSVHTASREATVWLSHGISYSRERTQGAEEELNAVWYCHEAVDRLMAASSNQHHLVVNGPYHYRAVREIEAKLAAPVHPTKESAVLELIKLSLPRLVAVSPQAVVEIRSELKDFLEPFRAEMAKLTATLPFKENLSDLEGEVQAILRKDILPRIVELRRFLGTPGRTLRKHLISGATGLTTSAITLVGAVLAGLPLGSVIAATPFVHLLTAGLKAATERSEKKWDNPLTFAVLAEQAAIDNERMT